MFIYPKIDPVALDLGFIQIHWYGLMYLTAFASAWWLGQYRASRKNSGWNSDQVGDMIFYGALGVVLGGRVGYMLFYNFSVLLDDPFALFRVWEGGMSFHGGLIGVMVAMLLFGRRHKKTFFETTDFVSPLVPLGYFAGRIGNFINGELWGRVTDVPWGMVFPHVDQQVRHPSMLYQGLLEGLVLFIILWVYSTKPRPRMAVSGVAMIGFGVFRFSLEFLREPDAHLGFVALHWMTMGQVLSIPLIILGAVLLAIAYKRKDTDVTNSRGEGSKSKGNVKAKSLPLEADDAHSENEMNSSEEQSQNHTQNKAQNKAQNKVKHHKKSKNKKKKK